MVRSLCTRRPIACSNSSAATGRFSSARIMLLRSLSSSNGWRVLSDLMTRGMTSSAVSKVVKRSLQSRHCRRRRTWRPSAARRESITLVSSWLQNGQYMRGRRYPGQRTLSPSPRRGAARPPGRPPGTSRPAMPPSRRPRRPPLRGSLPVDREALAKLQHLPAHPLEQDLVVEIVEDVADPPGQPPRLGEPEAARGDRRGAEPEPAGDERRARIARHGVLVHRDVRAAEGGIGVLAGDPLVDQRDEQQVVV